MSNEQELGSRVEVEPLVVKTSMSEQPVRCEMCGTPVLVRFSVPFVVPLKKGPQFYEPENIDVMACKSCFRVEQDKRRERR